MSVYPALILSVVVIGNDMKCDVDESFSKMLADAIEGVGPTGSQRDGAVYKRWRKIRY